MRWWGDPGLRRFCWILYCTWPSVYLCIRHISLCKSPVRLVIEIPRWRSPFSPVILVTQSISLRWYDGIILFLSTHLVHKTYWSVTSDILWNSRIIELSRFCWCWYFNNYTINSAEVVWSFLCIDTGRGPLDRILDVVCEGILDVGCELEKDKMLEILCVWVIMKIVEKQIHWGNL